jgi:uncharacterized membrane protein
MMDDLELLKKDWQKKEMNHPKLSYNDIHRMLWRKSSSIVKWIFIISIMEILLPQVVYLFPSFWSSDGMLFYNNLGLTSPLLFLSVIYYGVVLYFILQFYKRYKEISVLDNAKNLMGKIIKTRKTVKNYVFFSLSMILVFFMTVVFYIYMDDDFIKTIELSAKDISEISKEKLENIKLLSMVIFTTVGVFFTLLVGFIYFLLYGLLLKKLNRNYQELKRLEV